MDGEKNDVITFADADGTQITLYVGARSSLLTKYETLADNPVLGDTVTETRLADYRRVGGVQVPFRVVTRVAGQVTQDVKYSDIKVNASPEGPFTSLRPPRPGDAPTRPTTVTVTKIADDVFLLAGSSHNSLLVTFPIIRCSWKRP